MPGPWLVYATERSREEDVFTYDIDIKGMDGSLRERWEGLRLRTINSVEFQGPWAGVLLGPYVERRVQELIPGSAVGVAVEQDNAERRSRSERAIRRALGEERSVLRRSDGKPWLTYSLDVSAAHCGDLTLAVAGSKSLGCDVEAVKFRSDGLWQSLLGKDRLALAEFIAQETGEEKAAAATRVWAAGECLKKAGAMVDAPLVLGSTTADGWVLLSSGPLVTATFVTSIRSGQERIVLAVLTTAEGLS